MRNHKNVQKCEYAVQNSVHGQSLEWKVVSRIIGINANLQSALVAEFYLQDNAANDVDNTHSIAPNMESFGTA